ncbi:MAG: polysaccharide pyruvyl transferase family protein [Armatimonadota bacterium]
MTQQKTVLLVGHGGYYNRGCEAIVRSTVALLRQVLGPVRIILSSCNPGDDATAGYALTDRIIPATAQRWTPSWALARLADLRNRQQGLRWWLAPVTAVLREVDIVLSIGGDNYCYGTPHYFIELNRSIHRHGIPLVLWGASIDAVKADEATCRDLQDYDLITARESLTVTRLAECGITSNVRHVADPAFLLPSARYDLTEFCPRGEGILGFNISPLLARYHRDQSASPLVQASVAALRHCIDHVGLGVLLVPHVTGGMPPGEKWNDDRLVLEEILQAVDRPGAITLMPSTLDAMQSKYVIAQCRLFIGARTHSTIAALSSCVPTLSIGYSIKAWGINHDIFGHTHYVVDSRQLNVEVLPAAVGRLLRDEDAIRQHLTQHIPHVIEGARQGADHLSTLVGSNQVRYVS